MLNLLIILVYMVVIMSLGMVVMLMLGGKVALSYALAKLTGKRLALVVGGGKIDIRPMDRTPLEDFHIIGGEGVVQTPPTFFYSFGGKPCTLVPRGLNLSVSPDVAVAFEILEKKGITSVELERLHEQFKQLFDHTDRFIKAVENPKNPKHRDALNLLKAVKEEPLIAISLEKINNWLSTFTPSEVLTLMKIEKSKGMLASVQTDLMKWVPAIIMIMMVGAIAIAIVYTVTHGGGGTASSIVSSVKGTIP